MKKKAYYLFALLAGMMFLLASCEELETPYNTVPSLSEVTVSPNSKQDWNYTLSHEGKNANSGYYEVSQYDDMRDAQHLNASRTSGSWRAEVDLLPATTYYIRLVLSNYNSSVAGPVTKYETPGIAKKVNVGSITMNSAYITFYWNRTDTEVSFQYSTNEDMKDAMTLTPSRSGTTYSYHLNKLSEYKTYYVRVKIKLPSGEEYFSPVTQFRTTKGVTITVTGSETTGNARYWIEGENGTTSGSTTSNSWGVNVSEPSNVYIFKPMKSSYSSYKEVPIYYTDFDFFEWGSGKIDPTSAEYVSCKMQKWQAYHVFVSISIKSANGATSSKAISRVEIANAGTAEAISTNATFDVSSGTMTPVKNNAAKWTANPNIPLNSPKQHAINFRSLIPTKFNNGEVKVNIVLNDSNNMTTEVYPATLPASSWERGNDYNYPITLTYTRTDVEVTVGDVTVTPWKEGGNTNIDIYD